MTKRGRPSKENIKSLGKTEVFQFRIDPKSRYAMEIAANNQRRTLCGIFDVAVQNYIKGHKIENTFGSFDGSKSLMDIVEETWDRDEIVRFLNRARLYPFLLTPAEMDVFDVINKEQLFQLVDGETKSFNIPVIKELWGRILDCNANDILEVIKTQYSPKCNTPEYANLIDAINKVQNL